MLDIFSGISDYLLAQSIQIAAIFAVVWTVCFLLKRKSAHLRYLLWLLVIAKCIFPSVVKVSLAVLPEKEVAAIVAEPVMHEPAAASSVAVEFENAVYDGGGFAEASFFDRLSDIGLMSWVGIVWACGVVLFFAVVCFKAWLLNMKLRSMRKETDIDGDNTIKVWQIDGIAQPFVWGMLRGSVYVPGDFDSCGSAEDRRGILMHEFAHVRRFDAGVNVLQIIAQGLFWFHPLVWMANTMIRKEREKCCDEAAIAGLKTVPRNYGKAIIDTLAREYESNMPVPSLAIAGPVKNIEDRIKTIMRPGKKFYTHCGVFTLITTILLAMVTLPVGCVLTNRTDKYDESLMEVQHHYLAMTLYESQKEMKDDIKDFDEVISTKESQIPVEYILSNIFPSADAGSVNISHLQGFSEGFVGEPKPDLRFALFIELEVKHVPVVHKKIAAYVKKHNKKFEKKNKFPLVGFKPVTRLRKGMGGMGGGMGGMGGGISNEMIAKAELVREQKTQVSIECRLIAASSKFMEEIGIEKPKKRWFSKPKKFEKPEGVTEIGDIREPYYKPEVSYELFEGDNVMEGKLARDHARRMTDADSGGIRVYYIDDSVVKNIFLAAQQEKDGRILTSPKVAVIDGETATIAIHTERNYISDFEEVVDDKGKSFKAVTQYLNTGLDLELKPLVLKDNRAVDLTVDLDISNLLKLKEYKHKSGQKYDVPQWEQIRLKTRLEVDSGKTLMIAGIKITKGKLPGLSDKDGIKFPAGLNSMIILIKPTVIEPAEGDE